MVPIKIAYVIYIGKRVRIARTQRGLSQQELANRMGFADRQTIAAIESGKRGINFQELELLAKIFKKSIYFFSDAFRLVCEETPRYLLTNKVPKRIINDFEKTTMFKSLGVFRFLLN